MRKDFGIRSAAPMLPTILWLGPVWLAEELARTLWPRCGEHRLSSTQSGLRLSDN